MYSLGSGEEADIMHDSVWEALVQRIPAGDCGIALDLK